MIDAAGSEQRNAMAAATSSGVENRPIGTALVSSARRVFGKRLDHCRQHRTWRHHVARDVACGELASEGAAEPDQS